MDNLTTILDKLNKNDPKTPKSDHSQLQEVLSKVTFLTFEVLPELPFICFREYFPKQKCCEDYNLSALMLVLKLTFVLYLSASINGYRQNNRLMVLSLRLDSHTPILEILLDLKALDWNKCSASFISVTSKEVSIVSLSKVSQM